MKRQGGFFTKRHIGILAVLLIAIIAGLLVLRTLNAIEFRPEGDEDVYDPEVFLERIEYRGDTYVRNPNCDALLVIGVDSYMGEEIPNYNNTQRADFLLLIGIDKIERTAKILQINRDTMVTNKVLGVMGDVVDYRDEQIALAHTYGSGFEDSCVNTVASVSKLLKGININHYISFTMDAVASYNDLVGGVPVSTEYINGTNLEDRFEGEEEVDGNIVLHGGKSLEFVRYRDMDKLDANLMRMGRQRHYLSALKTKTNERVNADSSFILDALMAVNDYMVSDCTVNQLSEYGNILSSDKTVRILTMDGENKDGGGIVEFYPYDNDIKEKLIEIFYEREE